MKAIEFIFASTDNDFLDLEKPSEMELRDLRWRRQMVAKKSFGLNGWLDVD